MLLTLCARAPAAAPQTQGQRASRSGTPGESKKGGPVAIGAAAAEIDMDIGEGTFNGRATAAARRGQAACVPRPASVQLCCGESAPARVRWVQSFLGPTPPWIGRCSLSRQAADVDDERSGHERRVDHVRAYVVPFGVYRSFS